MNKIVKLSLALLITSNVFANEMDADLHNVTASVIENSQIVASVTTVSDATVAVVETPEVVIEAPIAVEVTEVAPIVTVDPSVVVENQKELPVASNGYIANAKARLASVATSTKAAVVDSANFVKTKTVNGALTAKDFTKARFQKATYINADGTYNKREVAKTAAAVVVTAAVVYGVYKLCTKNNSSEDDEDEEDFNS